MEKQELLNEITKQVRDGEVTEEEIRSAFRTGQDLGPAEDPESAIAFSKHVSATEILYYFGGLVTFIGVAILLAQNWDSMPDIVKILATSVLGAVLLAGGIYLSTKEKLAQVGQAFILAGGLIFPVGIYVILRLSDVDIDSLAVQSAVSAAVAAVFLVGFWQFQKTLLLLFAIAWTTACYFILGGYMFQDTGTFLASFVEYQILIAGLSYLGLAYYFSQGVGGIKRLSGVLYGFGIIGFLAAAFVLATENGVWEALFPLLALTAMFGSVKVRSRLFLIAGAIGLISYILHITSKYFAESVGWPVALIVAGFALIGIGYFTVQVNNKYFNKRQSPV